GDQHDQDRPGALLGDGQGHPADQEEDGEPAEQPLGGHRPLLPTRSGGSHSHTPCGRPATADGADLPADFGWGLRWARGAGPGPAPSRAATARASSASSSSGSHKVKASTAPPARSKHPTASKNSGSPNARASTPANSPTTPQPGSRIFGR